MLRLATYLYIFIIYYIIFEQYSVVLQVYLLSQSLFVDSRTTITLCIYLSVLQVNRCLNYKTYEYFIKCRSLRNISLQLRHTKNTGYAKL